MELTLDEVLQKAVEAHKEGKLEDAERFYRAILESYPGHPDANHNLGVLAVSVNKADAALPLFKTALEANLKKEQFWLSYIDALIKEQQFDNAKQVLEKGKNQGLAGEKVNALESHLTLITQAPRSKFPKQKKSLTLSEKRKKLAENKKKKGEKQNLKGISPSEAEVNNLLQHYQTGRYGDAELLALSITERFPEHQFGWKVLGAVLKQTGRVSESLVASQKSVQLAPQDAEAHNNLGITLKELVRLEEAEASYSQAIALKPNFTEAHYNLGVTLQKLDRLEEAEVSYSQAIALKPNFAEAHSNLGNTLKELGRLSESEASYMQAIALQPDDAEAHYNLGNALKKLGKLDESEASLRQAIALKPDFAEAHSNLGITLKELGRLDEAEASYTQAISLKPDFAKVHSNLGGTLEELGKLDEAEASYRQAIRLKHDYALAHSHLSKVLYVKGYKDLAIESIEKANHFDPQSKEFKLLLSVMKSRKSREGSEAVIGDTTNTVALTGLTSSPLILKRVVEAELIANIYELSGMEMDKTKRYGLLPAGRDDARYGNGICSPDFNLFKDGRSIIQKLAKDLTRTMMEAVKSDIYIFDSFFNILRAGGGSTPHMHLNKLDKNIGLNLAKQKYSLVYYLAAGDQNCSEPGILNLYDPVEDILPCDGMITIIPASRLHSAVYSGKTDRVMIGVNFYSL